MYNRQVTDVVYEMLPGLFISSFRAAKIAMQKAQAPVFIANLANGTHMLSRLGVQVKVDDDLEEKSFAIMSAAIPPIVDEIRAQMMKGVTVLVHCHAGIQRSATIIAAYIMKYEGLNIERTIAYMKSKKPDVFLGGVNFISCLEQFQESLNTN